MNTPNADASSTGKPDTHIGSLASTEPAPAEEPSTEADSERRENTDTQTNHACDVAEQKLHSATLFVPCLEMLLHAVVPALIVCLFIPFGTVIFYLLCAGLVPTVVFHALRYLTFRYELTKNELVLSSGVIFRRERRIPLDRVQELEIRRGVLHRILDLAILQIKTAGGDEQEANLNVISRSAAESVKEKISIYQSNGTTTRDRSTAASIESSFSYELSIRDLVLGGLSSKLVASLGAIVAAVAYFQVFASVGGKWLGRFEQDIEQRVPGEAAFDRLTERIESFVPDLGPLNFMFDLIFDETLPKSLSLVVLGFIGAVAAYVIRYYGFHVTRNDDLLVTSYGMLTIRRGSLRRDRIQALKLEEGLLRRFLGLAAIRVDSAGDRNQIDEDKKRDVLIPVASRNAAHEIARQAIPSLNELDPPWKRISPLAVMRGSKKGWLLISLAMLQTFGIANWLCLAWLPAIPLVYVLNYQWYRNTGYWLDERHFLSRRGWLNRSTTCLPIKNIQNVIITQNFFDRRLDLATISLDTAGQSNTGGGPIIRHLPIEDARHLQSELASRVAATEFTW